MRRRPLFLVLLLLAGSVTGLALWAGNGAEGEVHFIPESYVGRVVIVFNAPAGPPAEFDQEGRRIYRAPISGVILTRLASNVGDTNVERIDFFAVDDSGAREEIPKGWSSDDPEQRAKQKRIFSGSAGVLDLNDINCRIEYLTYYVGTEGDLESRVGTFDLEQYFRRHPGQCPPLNK